MAYPPVASFSSESFVPTTELAGDKQIITQRATILSGQVLAYLRVLGKVTASGKLVAHNPGASDGSEVAVAIAAYAVDASGGDVVENVITQGEFAMQALAYHASTDTDAEKLALFPLGHPISIKKLAYGAA